MPDLMDYFAETDAELADPNSELSRLRKEFQKDFEYLNNPDIPEHEKELQMALDADIPDPRPLIEQQKKLYEHWCKTGDLPFDDMYEVRSMCPGSGSLEFYVEFLKKAISEESIKLKLQAYEEHLALRKEAIKKGFIKGGYGKRRFVSNDES